MRSESVDCDFLGTDCPFEHVLSDIIGVLISRSDHLCTQDLASTDMADRELLGKPATLRTFPGPGPSQYTHNGNAGKKAYLIPFLVLVLVDKRHREPLGKIQCDKVQYVGQASQWLHTDCS